MACCLGAALNDPFIIVHGQGQALFQALVDSLCIVALWGISSLQVHCHSLEWPIYTLSNSYLEP